jgi:hypothetical protein
MEVACFGPVAYVCSTEQFRPSPLGQVSNMQPIWVNAAALAVVAIYFIWRALQQVNARRRVPMDAERVLRERVAYMLWVTAETVEETASHGSRG